MNDDQLNAALQAEYLHIQKTIEDFDSRALTIKAWSMTFSLAAIAGAFASHSSAVFLIAAISAAVFWLLETQWKLFQMSYYPRAELIAEHFRGEQRVEHPFQIGPAWYKRWAELRGRGTPQVMRWPHIALPHAIVVILGIALFILTKAQVITV